VDELRVIVKKALQKVKQKMIPQTFFRSGLPITASTAQVCGALATWLQTSASYTQKISRFKHGIKFRS